MKNTWFGVTSSLAVLAVLAASPAFAQDQVPDQTEAEKSQTGVTDIVVTANRREQNLQDVGISIAAFTGEQLDDLQVTNAGDVAALTPNVEIVRSYASPGFNTQITIRGVGQPDFQDTTEAVVTSYVDEFYMVGAGQADFLAFDVARVEVARGPQGTVQGRNSTAGSINYYTNTPDPDETSGQASITLGEYGLVRTSAYANLALGGGLAIRGAFSTDSSDGYIRNINPESPVREGGQGKFRAGRLQARYEGVGFNVNLKAEFGRLGPTAGGNEESLPTGQVAGQVGVFRRPADGFGQNEQNIGAGAIYVVNTDGPNILNAKLQHYLGRVEVNASDSLSLVALAGYLKNDKDEIEDCDHTPLSICLFSNLSKSEHWMGEVRAVYDGGPFRLTGGANYLNHDIDAAAVTPLFFERRTNPLPPPLGFYAQYFRDQQSLKSWSVFGQFEYDLTDQLTLIGGARYTKDKKVIDSFDAVSFDIPLSTRKPTTLAQFFALVPQILAKPSGGITTLNRAKNGDEAVFDKGLIGANLQLNYKPSDDLLVYTSYRRGAKSGGFITGNVAGFPTTLSREYGEETNNAYELGFKSTLADRRVRLNGAVFYYDYQNMQQTSLINITNVITNNDTKVWGGELELQAQPTDGLTVSLGAGYVDSKIKGICNPTGAVPAGCAPSQPAFRASLPLSPKFTGNFLVRYEWDAFGGTPFVQASGRGRAKMFRDSLNNQANTIGSGFTTDATVGFKGPDDRWKLALWVNNLFDSQHEVNAFEISGVAGVGEIVYQMPRWFGGTFTVTY